MPEDQHEALKRFAGLCAQVDVDAQKLIKNPPPILVSMIRQWFIGELDDVAMMRCLRNLAIFDPNWAIVHQGEIE